MPKNQKLLTVDDDNEENKNESRRPAFLIDKKDRRNVKDFSTGNTPRGIICQLQIVTAIYSDFCSLLGTLLLSLRCYDVINNKK